MTLQRGVTIPDTPFLDISYLHDTAGYSYRQIACFSPYDEVGIPAGTLATIHKTGRIPRRWLAPLGATRYPRRPRRAISLTDAASAAETILRHGGVAYALQLADELRRRMTE